VVGVEGGYGVDVRFLAIAVGSSNGGSLLTLGFATAAACSMLVDLIMMMDLGWTLRLGVRRLGEMMHRRPSSFDYNLLVHSIIHLDLVYCIYIYCL